MAAPPGRASTVARLDRGAPAAESAGLGRVLMRLTELGSERDVDLGYTAGLRAIDEWRATAR
jgi:hypothetical protein